MSDLISRQAAIDLCDWYDNPSMHDDLEKLPSAQPEIIQCKECRYWIVDQTCYVWSKSGTIRTRGDDFCSRAERHSVWVIR